MSPRPTPRPRTRPSPLVSGAPVGTPSHRAPRPAAHRVRRRAGTAAVIAGAALTAGLAPPASAETSHEVRPGDTVSGLAARFATSVDELAEANGLADPDLIVAGTTLVVPAAGSGAVAAGSSPVSAVAPSDATSPTGPSPVAVDRRHLEANFDAWATANGVRPSLLKALCYLESGWQHDVVSSTGAVGVCQLMPATAADMATLIGVDLDRTVPDDNIRMGARYLRWLLERSGGDEESALAGYYQGVGSVARNGQLAETHRYVADVLALEGRF